jgi:hypothetical protein
MGSGTNFTNFLSHLLLAENIGFRGNIIGFQGNIMGFQGNIIC